MKATKALKRMAKIEASPAKAAPAKAATETAPLKKAVKKSAAKKTAPAPAQTVAQAAGQ
jgi:hypothetical protein